MSNILIHKASELRPATPAALEAELGRSLGDDKDVSVMAFPAHDPLPVFRDPLSLAPPSDQARAASLLRLSRPRTYGL